MTPLAGGTKAIHICAWAKTDVGRTRDNNEDRFLLADLTPSPSPGLSGPEGDLLGSKGYLLAVADGMGGAAAGEIASGMATGVVLERLHETWIPERRSSTRVFASCLDQAIVWANHQIHLRAGEDPNLQGMGSTLTAVGVLGEDLVFAQVGDSRAYLVRRGSAVQVTEDQSLVRHLLEEGRISETEAKEMPGGNLILQALGPRPTVEVDVAFRKARKGDTLVLCTDGLSGVVSADEIRDAVLRSHDPAAVCDDLVELANSRGGPDNITVVVGKLDGPGLSVPGHWE